MRAISRASIAYGAQILCIFCGLGLVIIWGLGVDASYGLCALVLGIVFITVTLCRRYLGPRKS